MPSLSPAALRMTPRAGDVRRSPSTIDRRNFLTVLGATGGGALALSGCSTEPGREADAVPGAVRGPDPGRGHLVREHLHRVRRRLRRARAHARRTRGQARGQSRAPGQPGQALLARPGGAAGALQSGPHQGPDGCAAPTARFEEITWDDAIARLAAKLTEAGGKVAVISRRGAGHVLRSARRVDQRRWADGWCATSRSTTSRCARPTARCSASTSCRRTTSARPSTSSRSAPTSSRPGSRRSRTSAASPSRTASPTATWPSSSTPAPRMDLTGLNADEWLADRVPAPRRRSRSPWPTSLARPSAARRRRLAAALARFTPAMAAQETGIPADADRAARARSSPRRKPSLAVAGGIGAQHARRGRALRRGQPAQLRRRQHRADGPVRRRSRRAATATPRSARLGGGDRRRRRSRCCWCTTPTRSTRCPRPRGFAERLKKVPFKVSTVALPRRDRRAVRPAAAAAPRARALGRSRAARRACGASCSR